MVVRDTAPPRSKIRLAYDSAGNEKWRYVDSTSLSVNGPFDTRRSYYSADGKLRLAEARGLLKAPGSNDDWNDTRIFEEFRYDALGRRVLVRARQSATGPHVADSAASFSTIRRTVWDGHAELYEIQVRGFDDDSLERDVPFRYDNGSGSFDPNIRVGWVAYIRGLGIDQPVEVIRMGYSALVPDYSTWAAFRITPLWNLQGQADLGYLEDGRKEKCKSVGNGSQCVQSPWRLDGSAYGEGQFDFYRAWHGSLLTQKQNSSGTYYRRNRNYDPQTGRFTQEDPIGLAGGINLYGYAGGDPVNNSDPFGLVADTTRHDRCAVAKILSDYIGALAEKPGEFADAVPLPGRGARAGYPEGFDFKTETPDDLYQVEGRWLRADEFGNYAAGYAGEAVYGASGFVVMRAGGIAYALDGSSGESRTDLESAPMINSGSARAQKDFPSGGMRGGVTRRGDAPKPLTSTEGCPVK